MNYGIPYQGSKNKILKEICKWFPKNDHFYDLFGGGFSISHYMIKHRSKDFKEFHYNEIRPGIPKLIQDAIEGKYNYNVFKPEWISREKFNAEKESNPYIKIIWSFGNDGRSYLFGEKIEKQKKSLHNAIVFNEFNDYAKEILGIDYFDERMIIIDRRLYLKNRIKVLGKFEEQLEQLIRIERLQQLQQLQQLERLQQLQQLQQLNCYNGDYREIKINDNSTIYCDIPYKGTETYDKNKNFDHDDFFEWASKQNNPLFISEYEVLDKRFKLIWIAKTRSTMAAITSQPVFEKLYCNMIAYDLIKSKRILHVAK